jgi:hypothetical protein
MSGFLVVNDGVGIAEDLARAITRKNASFREAPPSIKGRRVSNAQPPESKPSKASQTTCLNPEQSNNGVGKFGAAWSAFVAWLKRLRVPKKSAQP